jgi:hypothetical protein
LNVKKQKRTNLYDLSLPDMLKNKKERMTTNGGIKRFFPIYAGCLSLYQAPGNLGQVVNLRGL